LLTAASVNDRRAVERPLQTERSASDAHDNPTGAAGFIGSDLPVGRFVDGRVESYF
jgi:hypothetical protein